MTTKKLLQLTTTILVVSIIIVVFAGFEIIYGSNSQSQLSNVNSQISNTQKKLNDGKAIESKLNKEIGALENKINQTQAEINALNGNISEIQNKITAAMAELDAVEARMKEQTNQLNERLRAMYKKGSVGVLDVVLGSDNISDFMMNMDMIERVHKSDKAVLESLEKQYAMIDAQRTYLNNLQADLEREKAEEASIRAELQNDKSSVAAK